MTTRESEIEAYVKKEIESRGGLFFKFTSPGQTGVPDRIIVMPGGRVFFVEFKTKRGRITKVQFHQLKRLMELDAEASVIKGMDGAREWLHDLDEYTVMSGVWDGDAL